MKETNYWVDTKNKNKAKAKIPGCSAANYYCPPVNKVSTNINFEDDFFIPKYAKDSSCADIFAFLPKNNKSSIGIGTSGQFTIDCGFSIKIASGYKACFSLDASLLNKGLIINGFNQIDSTQDYSRVNINVLNIGEKILILSHKDKVGKIWIEPIYFFDWIY